MTFQSAKLQRLEMPDGSESPVEKSEVGNESRFKYPAETGAHAPDS